MTDEMYRAREIEESPDTVSLSKEAPTKIPWDLGLVSFLFILVGAYAGFSMIVALFQDSFHINYTVLLLPVGINLLRFRQGARSCAGSLLILALICLGLGMVLIWLARGPDFVTMQGLRLLAVPRTLTVLFLVLLFLLTFWMLRVMGRPEVDRLFWLGREKRFKLARGAKGIIVIAIVLGLVIAAGGGYFVHLADPCDGSRSHANENGVWTISYGYRFGKLSYVVFEHAPMGQSLRSMVHNAGSRNARLRLPDGGEQKLPSKTQLWEYEGTILHPSPERVTREQFEAFMASHPDEYTIEALLSFAEGTNGGH